MKYLIVVDMQNDFISGSLGSKEAEAIVPKLKKKIEDFDGAVIFTRDTHGEDYLNTQEGKKLPVKHCIEGTYGWEICKELKELVKTTPFDKPGFGSMELADYFRNIRSPIDELCLAGLCTDICVISNAMILKACLPETRITVDSSCSAGVTPESHENALKAMSACQIEII